MKVRLFIFIEHIYNEVGHSRSLKFVQNVIIRGHIISKPRANDSVYSFLDSSR